MLPLIGNMREKPREVSDRLLAVAAPFRVAPCVRSSSKTICRAGDDAAVADGDVDLDGNPCRQGSHVDMGAYEFQPAGFTMADARSALLFLSGVASSVEADLSRLDIVKDDSSAGVLDIRDAVLLARKAAGLEENL